MAEHKIQADVAIAGGGLAGLTAALDLVKAGKKVVVLERGEKKQLGGLARLSFGGVFLVNSKQQQKTGIKDSPDQAYRDWMAFGELEGEGKDSFEDELCRNWVRQYVDLNKEMLQGWLKERGLKIFPVVHWVERGLHRPGNSWPRFHMVWGTGYEIIRKLLIDLEKYADSGNLQLMTGFHVLDLEQKGGKISGLRGRLNDGSSDFSVESEQVIIASGGICGNLDLVRENWYREWGKPPAEMLTGAHPFCDGQLTLTTGKTASARVSNLDMLWSYAAGVHYPEPEFENHGLSVVPPKSALWMDATGKRIGPVPMVSGFDTRDLVHRAATSAHGYTWQVLNYKIAKKELAISGSEHNQAIKNKNLPGFLKNVLFGNKQLVDHLINDCIDFVTADTIEELAAKMNALTGSNDVNAATLAAEVEAYDANYDRGEKFFNDDQIRRLQHLRSYRGDKVRLSKNQKINDKSAGPLVAIRMFVLTRKTLGGLVTDLQTRVLDQNGKAVEGLYAVGEAAGFGGGGIHGKRALEGTFLGSCILNGRLAARHITTGQGQ